MNAVGNIVEICNNVSLVYSDILKAAMTILVIAAFIDLTLTDSE